MRGREPRSVLLAGHQAMAEAIVSAISARTVRHLLHEVDLQPPRTRYWKTAHLDALFKSCAEQILWRYANAKRWLHQGFWIVCVDERLQLNPTPSAVTAWLSRQARSPFAHYHLSAPGQRFPDLAIATKTEKHIKNLAARLGNLSASGEYQRHWGCLHRFMKHSG